MSDTATLPTPGTLGDTRAYSRDTQGSENVEWSVRMADSTIEQRPILSDDWSYESGLVLKGIEQVWLATREKKYLEYIRQNIELFVGPDGSIRTYNPQDDNLDNINTGKLLFLLRQETGDGRYEEAIHLLVRQLKRQPRTSEGGFWHKRIYPYQMWLDGIYMAAPFYAQYAAWFDDPTSFDDVAHQILLIERHTHDPKTGLFYHGWDESKMQIWANPQTGCSPQFWGRAMGWYAMALVDVLDFLPTPHQARERIITILDRMLAALMRVQDTTTGLWYQVLDRGGCTGNYTEASASCMFVYAFAKGIRKGYLAPKNLDVALRGHAGIIENLVTIDRHGKINLARTCQVTGLGGERQRNGSYDYYINEPVATNDRKGVGAFILACSEIEKVKKLRPDPIK